MKDYTMHKRKGIVMKKIIFFDIDGTLVNHDGVIPDSTKEALTQLKEKGHLRFVCTGRTKSMLPSCVTDLDFDGYVMGAGTHIEYENKDLILHTLSEEVVNKALSVLRKYQISFALEGPESVYVEREALEDQRPYFGVFIKSLGNIIKVIEDTDHICINKITCLFPVMEEEQIQEICKQLEPEFDVILHERKGERVLTDGLVEFVPVPFTKATGIAETIAALGLKQEQTVGVGDSNNDLPMLEYVNTAITMGNGSALALEAADFITSDIDEDGIYAAMSELGYITEL